MDVGVSSNPDPKNFKITMLIKSEGFTLAKVKYPDCVNYEGEKILIFEGDVSNELLTTKEIDPHFCGEAHLSPIARFRPDANGLRLALGFIRQSDQ